MSRRTPILAALAAALMVLVYLIARGAQAPPASVEAGAGGARPNAADVDASARTALVEDPGVAPSPGQSVADATRIPVDVGTGTLAAIRGRCVDEAGQPLAGVAVELRGWVAGTERMNRHRLDHGEVQWEDPADVSTGADGRFEHRFDPPPPYQFICEATAAGRVPVYGRWIEIAPGTTIDMGDVVLRGGVEVTGRLVDQDGVGVAKQSLALERRRGSGGAPLGTPRPRDRGFAATDAAGFFTARPLLPEGRYTIRAGSLVVREPQGAIELALPRADLRIVVTVPPPDQRPTIEGVVVDGRGQPVPAARIYLGDGRFRGSSSTGRDGAFVLKQQVQGPAAPVALEVAAAGFVRWRSEEPVAWGRDDLRISLISGPPLTLRVRRADDGAPVERFGVVLASIRPNGGWSSADQQLQHLGDHPGGVLELPRVTTGRFRLTVVPAESTGLPPSADREVEIEVGVPARFDVQIAPIVERVVEVVTSRGDPVRGARVELLSPRGGGPLTFGMTAMSIESARMNSPEHVAVLVDGATTDASGRVTLHGPSDAAVGLRLPGPGHVPALVTPFDLTAEGPARVVVGAGGRLVGRVEPVDVVAALRAEAGLPLDGPVDPRRRGWLPAILLQRDGPGGRETFPGLGKGVPLGADGRFELAGVPPGTWDVHLWWWRSALGRGIGTAISSHSRVVAVGVVVAEGEERELVLDLPSWRRHPVTFRVRVDGEPLRGTLSLRGAPVGPTGLAEGTDDRSLVVDGEDQIEAALPVGSWTSSVTVRAGEVRAVLPGPEFVVAADATEPTQVEIALTLGRCAVVIVDADGRPVPGVMLWPADGSQSRPTDRDGRTELFGPVGPTEYRTRRQPLMQYRAFQAWMTAERREREAADRAWVDLGMIDLLPGESSAPRTIRLPAEWAELPK